jgi:hypothetical protein
MSLAIVREDFFLGDCLTGRIGVEPLWSFSKLRGVR